MNRSLALLCSLFLTLLCLAGCENKSNPSSYQENSGHSIIDSAEASTASSSATTVASEPVSSQKIPYVVSSLYTGVLKGHWGLEGKLIQSKSQLDQLQLDSNYPTGKKYSDEYFSEKAFTHALYHTRKRLLKLQIDDIAANGDSLAVHYTSICPNPHTADMAYWRVLLEVSGDDVEGIRSIRGERRNETLPSWVFPIIRSQKPWSAFFTESSKAF